MLLDPERRLQELHDYFPESSFSSEDGYTEGDDIYHFVLFHLVEDPEEAITSFPAENSDEVIAEEIADRMCDLSHFHRSPAFLDQERMSKEIIPIVEEHIERGESEAGERAWLSAEGIWLVAERAADLAKERPL